MRALWRVVARSEALSRACVLVRVRLCVCASVRLWLGLWLCVCVRASVAVSAPLSRRGASLRLCGRVCGAVGVAIGKTAEDRGRRVWSCRRWRWLCGFGTRATVRGGAVWANPRARRGYVITRLKGVKRFTLQRSAVPCLPPKMNNIHFFNEYSFFYSFGDEYGGRSGGVPPCGAVFGAKHCVQHAFCAKIAHPTRRGICTPGVRASYPPEYSQTKIGGIGCNSTKTAKKTAYKLCNMLNFRKI